MSRNTPSILELDTARPRKSVLGFWVLCFEKDARLSEHLVLDRHYHFDRSVRGLAQALDQVERAKQDGLVARIVHVRPAKIHSV